MPAPSGRGSLSLGKPWLGVITTALSSVLSLWTLSAAVQRLPFASAPGSAKLLSVEVEREEDEFEALEQGEAEEASVAGAARERQALEESLAFERAAHEATKRRAEQAEWERDALALKVAAQAQATAARQNDTTGAANSPDEQVQALERRLKEREDELGAAFVQIQQLQHQLHQAAAKDEVPAHHQQALAKWQSLYDEAEQRLHSTRSKLEDEHQKAVAKHKSDNDELLKLLDESERMLDAQRQSLDAHRTAHGELNAMIETQKAQLKEWADKYELSEEALAGIVDELKRVKREHEGEVQELRVEVRGTKRILDRTKADLDACQQELLDARAAAAHNEHASDAGSEVSATSSVTSAVAVTPIRKRPGMGDSTGAAAAASLPSTAPAATSLPSVAPAVADPKIAAETADAINSFVKKKKKSKSRKPAASAQGASGGGGGGGGGSSKRRSPRSSPARVQSPASPPRGRQSAKGQSPVSPPRSRQPAPS